MKHRRRRDYPLRSSLMVTRTTAMRAAFVRAGLRVKGRIGTYQLPAWQVVFGDRR